MKSAIYLTSLVMAIVLAACGSQPAAETATATPTAISASGAQLARPVRMGMGMGGMMARHQAPIPEAYLGLTNPVPADEASLARGAEIYSAQCASCHGDGGMGDGPAAASLDPPPAPIAHTSQMMGDAYLFWRISEGGAAFNSVMPGWKETLDEQGRWDVINYIQALGQGQMRPGRMMGGAMWNPNVEAARQAEMLAEAVKQGVITQAEADIFAQVHSPLEGQMATSQRGPAFASVADRQAAALEALVEQGRINQAQADTFVDVHQRLIEAGLMQ